MTPIILFYCIVFAIIAIYIILKILNPTHKKKYHKVIITINPSDNCGRIVKVKYSLNSWKFKQDAETYTFNMDDVSKKKHETLVIDLIALSKRVKIYNNVGV